jgi:hypothetical protein
MFGPLKGEPGTEKEKRKCRECRMERKGLLVINNQIRTNLETALAVLTSLALLKRLHRYHASSTVKATTLRGGGFDAASFMHEKACGMW